MLPLCEPAWQAPGSPASYPSQAGAGYCRDGSSWLSQTVTVLLTITTTREPATDLGYLLHKHPDRVQSFGQAFGQAHVFYPEAAASRCTAALLLEIDPVGLVRGSRSGQGEGF